MTKVSNFLVLTTDAIIPFYRNDWVIIGRLSELTDKQCEEFVEFNYPFDEMYVKIYKNYSYVPLKPWDTHPWYESAKESFISRIRSEGIDISENDFIIKLND